MKKNKTYYRLCKEESSGVCGIYDNKDKAIAHTLQMSEENNKEYEVVEVIAETHRKIDFELEVR